MDKETQLGVVMTIVWFVPIAIGGLVILYSYLERRYSIYKWHKEKEKNRVLYKKILCANHVNHHKMSDEDSRELRQLLSEKDYADADDFCKHHPRFIPIIAESNRIYEQEQKEIRAYRQKKEREEQDKKEKERQIIREQKTIARTQQKNGNIISNIAMLTLLSDSNSDYTDNDYNDE